MKTARIISLVTVVVLLFELSLLTIPVVATDCPPGDYTDCVAVVSSPLNPLVPVIGAVVGAGVASVLAGRRVPGTAQPGQSVGPIQPTSIPMAQGAPPQMQVGTPTEQPAPPSAPASGPPPDSLPEEPSTPSVTLQPSGPPPAPPPPAPEMWATSNWVVGPDGRRVRVMSDATGQLGETQGDGAPGDGKFIDRQGNLIGVPTGYTKAGRDVIFKTGLPPGLFSSGNPIVDEFFYGGNDTLPGTGIPGTPSTTEMSDPNVRYKRIVYDNNDTGMRITYIFYRNEGSLMDPRIDEGTYRIAATRMTRIPK